MPKLTEKGFAPLLTLLLLAGGIIVGVSLTQQAQIFSPKAQENTTSATDSLPNYVPTALEVRLDSPIKPGDSVKVFWSNPWSSDSSFQQAKPKDWIGLYFRGNENQGPGTNKDFKAWVYMGSCSKTAGQVPTASGSCDFLLPDGKIVADGQYEFRMFTDNGFNLLTTSNSFTISAQDNVQQTHLSVQITENKPVINPEDKIKIAWDNLYSSNRAPSATDWVGIYKQGDPDDVGNKTKRVCYNNNDNGECQTMEDSSRVYYDWIYLGSCTKQSTKIPSVSGSCEYKLPETVVPGTYNVRAYANNGFTKFNTSTPFKVDAVNPPRGNLPD